MSSTNKKGAGLILSLLTAVAGAVGLGFCIVNAGTDSFRKIGTSPIVIGCAVIAILALVLRVVLPQLFPAAYGRWVHLSAGAWFLGFGILGLRLLPRLIAPRIDGKEH